MGFSQLDSLREHHKRAIDFVVGELPDMFGPSMRDADHETGSPIEAIFSLWWTALDFVDFMCVRDLDLSPQYNQFIDEKNYRLDFAILPKDTELWMHAFEAGIPYQRIGVELDGHDFHERTKEQVELRNRRDRDLQNADWRIFHFAGSEIHRDPLAAVKTAAIAASEALNEVRTKYAVRQFKLRANA